MILYAQNAARRLYWLPATAAHAQISANKRERVARVAYMNVYPAESNGERRILRLRAE
jgi:hypothetical protein